MYPDRLYELAFAFRKAKLWKNLYDTELFAVSLPNGEIGYCSIMGSLGEHLALAIYVGSEGLDSYRLLMDLGEKDISPLKAQESMLSQNCLQCSFESKDTLAPQELSAVRSYAAAYGLAIRGSNAFPQFVRYRQARYPCPVSEQGDTELLCAALEAALAVSEKLKHTSKSQLGFSEGAAYGIRIPILASSEEGFTWSQHPLPPRQPVQYPEPVLRNELLMARLKKTKKRRGAWVCDVIMVPQPIMEYETSSPIFPYTLLTAVCESEMALPTEIVSSLEGGAEALLHALSNRMLEYGIPKELQVPDERTYTLLKNLAAQLNIRLKLQPENEFLDELEADFLNYFDEQTPDTEEDEIMLLSEMLMSMDDAALLSMPNELWEQLCSFEHQGMLDEDLARRVHKLQKRKK